MRLALFDRVRLLNLQKRLTRPGDVTANIVVLISGAIQSLRFDVDPDGSDVCAFLFFADRASAQTAASD